MNDGTGGNSTPRTPRSARAPRDAVRPLLAFLIFALLVGGLYGLMHLSWLGEWRDHPGYWRPHVTYGERNDDLCVVLKTPEACRLNLVYETESGDVWSAPAKVYGDEDRVHHVLPLDGLRPYEDIRYRIEWDGRSRNPLPESVIDDLREPRVIGGSSLFGDAPRSLRFAVYGDIRPVEFGAGTHTFVIDAIARERPDFVIHVGDMVQWADRESNWARFFSTGQTLFRSVPVLPCPGNHEYPKKPAVDGKREQRCDEYLSAFHLPGAESYYGRTISNVHFISLDITRRGGARNRAINDAQLAWLDGHLPALSRGSHDWLVVFFHNPVRTTINNWDRVWDDVIGPVFTRHGVSIDLIFCGHVHQYERLFLENAGCWQVVTAGGGSETHACKIGPVQEGSEIVELSHSYSMVEISDLTLRLRARYMKGETFDELVLTKKRAEREP